MVVFYEPLTSFSIMLAIVITDSTGYTHFHPISATTGQSYSLGRSESCDFSLPHEATLSEVHCFLSVVDGYVYLQDNGSTNGILADSRTVTAEYMAQGREYILGSCRLMLMYTEDEQTQQPVRKVAKLKAKTVTATPAPQPTYETPAPAAQPARKIAKLKAKTITAAPVYEQPAPEPVYEQPAPEPVYEQPAPEPVYEQPAPEPVYEQPAPEPVYEQPAPEPVYEQPAPEPVYEQPAPEPVYEQPAPEPVYEQPAPEPVYEQPAPEPVYEQPAPEPEATAQPITSPTPESAAAKSTDAGEKKSTSKKKGGRKTPTKAPTRMRASKAAKAAAHATYEPEAPRTGALAELPKSFDLKLRLINDKHNLKVGTALRFGLTADCNCYIYLLQYDSEGQANLLVPGDADIAHKLFKSIETQFPSVNCKDYDLMVEEPVGKETIIALACTQETNFAEVWQNLVNSSTEQPTAGTLELQAMTNTKTDSTHWSSFVLGIQTKL